MGVVIGGTNFSPKRAESQRGEIRVLPNVKKIVVVRFSRERVTISPVSLGGFIAEIVQVNPIWVRAKTITTLHTIGVTVTRGKTVTKIDNGKTGLLIHFGDITI